MPDTRFFETLPPRTLKALLEITDCELLEGNPNAVLTGVAPCAESHGPDCVIHCESTLHLSTLAEKKFGLCVTTPELANEIPRNGAVATSTYPKAAFALCASAFYKEIDDPSRMQSFPDSAQVDETAVVSATAAIGEGVRIGANVFVGPGVSIGAGTIIESGVSITHALIGQDVNISAGVRIGQAGFGFAETANGMIRAPQLGRVLVKDKVEIGANSTIDRGALTDTIIGEGTKIDNLVQIGHNVIIGRNCVIAGQSGVSGSCAIGDGVMMGGQVGLADHVAIGDGAMIAASAGLMRDVPPGETWGGTPAKPMKQWLREVALLTKLTKKRDG